MSSDQDHSAHSTPESGQAGYRKEAPKPLLPFPLAPEALDKVVFLRSDRKLHRIPVCQILYLQADGNYVELIMEGQRMVLRNSLSEMLKCMPEGIFRLVNRSQALNILLVDAICSDEVHIGPHTFSLSPRYRKVLLKHLHIVGGR